MENPDFIATLIPTGDRSELARNAFLLPENETRHRGPTERIPTRPTISNRESTPADDCITGGGAEYDFSHRILLHFDDGMKNATKGITFGSDPERSDVLLGYRGTIALSGLHFYLTFDEEGHVFLTDESTYGMAVSYDGQAKDEIRRRFTWRLDLKKENGSEWDVEVHVPHGKGLSFKVQLASHDTCKDEYRTKVLKFIAAGQDPSAQFGWLRMGKDEVTEPPSQIMTPRRRPVYIRDQKLGSGSFSSVYKLVDASTGLAFAGKYFRQPRGQGRRAWSKAIEREVRIMNSISHEYVVKALDYIDDPKPLLVMPYYALGSLDCQGSLTMDEITTVLDQALQGLQYLHLHEMDRKVVAHRDIKPANILVVHRYPLKVQLADFGLSKDSSQLISHCGTFLYAAPEVSVGAPYSTAVDIWSLAVVIAELAFGLPEEAQAGVRQSPHSRALAWCQQIVDSVNFGPSHPIKEFLATYMLKMEPRQRLSAAECLKEGIIFGILDDSMSGSGSATPTQQMSMDVTSDVQTAAEILTFLAAPVLNGPDYSRVEDLRLVGEPWMGHMGATLGPHSADTNGDLTRLGSYKRQRPRAKRSTEKSSDRGRTKRRQSNVIRTEVKITKPRSYILSDQRPQNSDESTKYRSMHSAVCVLLKDLCLGNHGSHNDNQLVSDLVGDLCEHFTQLGITELKVSPNNSRSSVDLKAFSTSHNFILASLTSSELMNSTTDLAAHLLHILRLQTPQPQSKFLLQASSSCFQGYEGLGNDDYFSQLEDPTTLISDSPVEEFAVRTVGPINMPAWTRDLSAMESRFVDHESITTSNVEGPSYVPDAAQSQTTMSKEASYGVTYPSALLDDTNCSGCSVPFASVVNLS